jgi:hypothetical protein
MSSWPDDPRENGISCVLTRSTWKPRRLLRSFLTAASMDTQRCVGVFSYRAVARHTGSTKYVWILGAALDLHPYTYYEVCHLSCSLVQGLPGNACLCIQTTLFSACSLDLPEDYLHTAQPSLDNRRCGLPSGACPLSSSGKEQQPVSGSGWMFLHGHTNDEPLISLPWLVLRELPEVLAISLIFGVFPPVRSRSNNLSSFVSVSPDNNITTII